MRKQNPKRIREDGDALELPKKDGLRGRTLSEQGRLEVEGEEEAVGRRGGNNPAAGEALRAISMAISGCYVVAQKIFSQASPLANIFPDEYHGMVLVLA
ncbi:unnamed protein product [Arabidopsis lyrata]|nr:unnamed protein product [Arabidopsis lyrata]